MKYRVGDKVKIKTDLKRGGTYCADPYTQVTLFKDMEFYKGNIGVVECITKGAPLYKLADIPGYWAECMLEGSIMTNEAYLKSLSTEDFAKATGLSVDWLLSPVIEC